MAGAISIACSATAAAAGPVRIVAAESVYGDIARQIGGAGVHVVSVLSSPDQDPHLFEATPSVARALAGARVVIENGIGYDPWMGSLLRANPEPDRVVIDVGALTGRKPGDNPHLWYDLAAIRPLAKALADELGRADPGQAHTFSARADQVDASLVPIQSRIAALRARLAGTPVTATEPIFGYMFAALGLAVRNEAFQVAVMNGTEPSPSQVARFESDLRSRAVRLLVYNSQATDPIAERMRAIAEQAGVPVLAVSETEPAGLDYQQWIARALDGLAGALSA